MNRGLFYLSFFLLILGAGITAAGAWLRERERREKQGKGEVRAKVVDLLLKEDENAAGSFRNKYYPVFQYYAGGRHYEQVGRRGAYPAAWQKGQSVLIEYDLRDPSVYRITNRGFRDYLPMGLYGGGIGIMVLGAVLFLRFAMR